MAQKIPRDVVLQRVEREGTPLISSGKATFVWQGDTAPYLVGDFNNWGWRGKDPALLHESAPGIWTYTVSLPSDAYIEYFFTFHPEDDSAPRVNDMFNRRKVSNGLGKANHYFGMPSYRPTTYSRIKAGLVQGTVTRHEIAHPYLMVGGDRDVWLYQPPTNEPAHLLVVYDGRDYYERAKITTMVDLLLAQRKIRPVALAMVGNARHGRFVEYDASEATLLTVGHLVLPLAAEHLNLIDIQANPGAYGAVGASMGGLMALYTGLRMPETFGHVIAQAGAYQMGITPMTGSPGTGPQEALIETLLKNTPRANLNIWQDVGTFDWLVEMNRTMHLLLKERGYTVTYREYSAGHNYPAWRDSLPNALMHLFGV